MKIYTEADIRRFYSYVAVGKPNECWEWQGFCSLDGYGRFRFDGKSVGAHRFIFWFTTGVDPRDYFVCHHCDNPSCVNPKHLWMDTQKANIQDAVKKERVARGETHGMSKLTDKKVCEIRMKYATGEWSYSQLANEYGVGSAVVCKIVRLTIWKHV